MDYPDNSSQIFSRKTTCQHFYVCSAGEIKKLLVDALRKMHQERRLRSRGKDRRGGIRNMRSIRERPEEAQSRGVPGHWEVDLIKGAFNGCAIRPLVGRTQRALSKSLTYDQGRGMALHDKQEKHLSAGSIMHLPQSLAALSQAIKIAHDQWVT